MDLRMVRPVVLLCSLYAAVSTFAVSPAKAHEDDFQIIADTWADPSTCNIDNARRISFLQAMDDSQDSDPCVAIEGFWDGTALYSRNRGLRKFTREAKFPRIGIYARREFFMDMPVRVKKFTMVGLLTRCETFFPRNAMVMGYCHYTDGVIIITSQVFDEKKRLIVGKEIQEDDEE